MHARYPHRLILFSMLLLAVNAFSQQGINTQIVAKRSYGMYLAKQWPELIVYGDSVLKLGFDYYYIRMRMGIAYFELKKYRIAEEHFKKAISFNANEDLAFEYLYFIYLYTDRFEESRKLSTTFSRFLTSELKTDSLPAVDCFTAEFGKKISSSDALPNANYLQLGLSHYIANKVSLFHAYTYYGQGNDDWKVHQNQYYLGMNLPLNSRFMLSGSFHFLQRSTAFYSGVSSQVKGPELPTTQERAFNYVESVSLKKSFNYFDVSAGSTVLWLDSVFQFQHNVSTTYFPFANSTLGIGAAYYLHSIDRYASVHSAFVPFVSYKPTQRLSLFASYLSNSGQNIAEWNGFVVNNSPDLTTGKFTLTGDYHLSKKMEVYATYQYEDKLVAAPQSNYYFSSFFAGLKYKP